MANDREPRSRIDLSVILLVLFVLTVVVFLTMDLWPFHRGAPHPR